MVAVGKRGKTVAATGETLLEPEGVERSCSADHHIATKAAREKAQQHPTSSIDYSDAPNSTH